MNDLKVVVDTNIFFSFLLRRQVEYRRVFLANTGLSFYGPRFFLIELFKHKERILRATELGDEEFLDCLSELLARIRFVEEGSIPVGT